MYPSPELRAELSAVNAQHGMMERHLKELTKEVKVESETFSLRMTEKVFLLHMNLDGYHFNEFTPINRPESLNSVISIELDWAEKQVYKIRCFAHATNENIYSELEKLALPF